MAGFRDAVAELEEVIRELRGASHLAGTLKAQDKEIEDEAIVLENEG